MLEAEYIACEDRLGSLEAVARDSDLLEGLVGKYKDHFLERVTAASLAAALQKGSEAMAEAQVEETNSNIGVNGTSNQVTQTSNEVARNIKDETKYALWSGASAGANEILKETEEEKKRLVPTLKISPGKIGIFSLISPATLTYLNDAESLKNL